MTTYDDLIAERIIAEDVPYAVYLAGDYGERVEWFDGKVLAMSAVSVRHELLTQWLKTLFRAYLDVAGGGVVLGDPVVMRSRADLPARQPDVMVILPDRTEFIGTQEVAGPANLVVEVVSPGSESTDRGAKFREYEQGGVTAYWIIDPLRRDALFYVRGDDDLFHNCLPVGGVYTSSVLDRLQLDVALLWQDDLPTTRETITLVEAWFR